MALVPARGAVPGAGPGIADAATYSQGAEVARRVCLTAGGDAVRFGAGIAPCVDPGQTCRPPPSMLAPDAR